MHEIAITTALMNLVEKEVARHGGGHVEEIIMSVGGLQAVEPSSIQSCFELLSAGTIMDGATLTIKRMPITIHCRDCCADGIASGDFHCSRCGGTNVRVLPTGGMVVNNIVVSKTIAEASAK